MERPEARRAGGRPAALPLRGRRLALTLFMLFYLAPLTLLFVTGVVLLVPLGSLMMVFIYGPPLAALWNTVLSWLEAPPAAPPFAPGSFEARRAAVFLFMGLVAELLSLWPSGEDPGGLGVFGWLALPGLPAAAFAVLALGCQLRADLRGRVNDPAA